MALRVLHLGKYYPPARGGMETYLRDLCEALERHGVECLALVHQEVAGQPAVRQQRDSQEPAVWRVPTLVKWLYTPVSPRLPATFHRALSEFQPHILHLHWPNPSALLALCLPAARRIPWVLHWHSDIVAAPEATRPFRLAYRLLAPFERRLLQRCRSIIVTSQAYLTSSNPLKAFGAKVHVVPLGRAIESLPGTSPRRHESGRLHLLAAGRLSHYKGFDVLIRAVSQCHGVSLALIGDGEERESLAELVRELHLSERVRLVGAVSEEQLAEELANCDCLVLPSTQRTEAFGVVLLEAMIAGKATIGSAIPGSGIGSVIEHGKTGLLTTPGDVASLSEAIVTLRDAPELTQQMGAAGRARFDQHYHIDHSAEQILAVYEAVQS